ncbi:hypothetical protein ACFU9Y_05865 [Streptomyces sp. NPDC057621]|uniref:hypothetical protein n=2 Tax=unclassified Streptomyces TaxID=2593676 RepID=UPI0036AE7CF1
MLMDTGPRMLIRKLFPRCVLRDVLLHGRTGIKAALFQKAWLNLQGFSISALLTHVIDQPVDFPRTHPVEPRGVVGSTFR